MKKVLYIPLDDRPCNYEYPYLLSKITDDIQLLKPPISLMGCCKKSADVDKIWEWIFENLDNVDYAILSVDTLVYGNIIHSRIHELSKEIIENRINNFRKIKLKNKKINIQAFNLVTRVSAYSNSFEDPDYWSSYGHTIWEYGWYSDRINRGIADDNEIDYFEKVKKAIPTDILSDFLERRKKNAYVNEQAISLVKENIFNELVIPKDDTALYGFAAIDQKKLATIINDNFLMNRVMIYPGADEVGSVLLSRIFCKMHNYKPAVFLKYSATYGPTIVPLYEDRPIAESIKSQIVSAGGILVSTPLESDFLFAIHTPGVQMEECYTQSNKNLTYSTHVNIQEFFSYLKYYKEKYNKPIALADDAFANGSDISMMRHASVDGIFDILCAYGGWNTSENTNGMCLAHAIISSYYEKDNFKNGDYKESQKFLVRKIIEDYLFQALGIPEMDVIVSEQYPGYSPYYCRDIKNEIANISGNLLIEKTNNLFPNGFKGKKIELSDFYLPWERIHELGFKLEFIEN